MSEYFAYISKIADQKKDILKSLDFINWTQHIKGSSTVFIKPNFTFPFYREGITTRPDLLRDLLELIKDRADNVVLGESDGGNRSFAAETAFEGHNMYEICREAGVELVNLSKMPSVPVEDVIHGNKVKVFLPKFLINEVDCFMSVPVLKVHVMTGVSLSIKNLWGCYPDTMRCLHHKHLNQKLTSIAKALNPKLVVIDGMYALDGHGPMYGTAKKTDLIISSNNPVVADSLGANIMGISTKKIDHILLANREGLGTLDLDEVKINDDWTRFKMDFHLDKSFLDNISWMLFNSEILVKIVMDSAFTPYINKVAGLLRNREESELAKEMLKTKIN